MIERSAAPIWGTVASGRSDERSASIRNEFAFIASRNEVQLQGRERPEQIEAAPAGAAVLRRLGPLLLGGEHEPEGGAGRSPRWGGGAAAALRAQTRSLAALRSPPPDAPRIGWRYRSGTPERTDLFQTLLLLPPPIRPPGKFCPVEADRDP